MQLVRWRLTWHSGKDIVGRWSKDAEQDDEQAWSHSKDGLAHAIIETKNIRTKEIKVVASIGGQDFCNFEWINFVKYRGPAVYKPTIMGLNLVCREDVVSIFMDGHVEHKKKTLPDEIFHYGKAQVGG